CQTDDLHEIPLAKLACHGAENAGSDGRSVFLDKHGGIFVKANVGTVLAANFLSCSDNDGVVNLTFFDSAVGDGLFYRDLALVAQTSELAGRAADRHDHLNPLRSRIVRDRQRGLHLNHKITSKVIVDG